MEAKQTLSQLFAHYLQYCVVMRNYAPATIASYKSTMKLFTKDTNCLYAEQMDKMMIEQWFFHGRLNRKWGPVTFRSHHKHLNKFLEWLVSQEMIKINWATKIEKPRLELKLPRTVSKDQAQLILDTSFHMKYCYLYERYRNRTIVGLMLLAGLRKKEVLHLKMQDVSFETKTIFINQGKGHKDRMVPMNYKLLEILKEYLKDSNRLHKESIYFFTTLQDNAPIGVKCVDLLIRKLRKRTKVNFSAHTLRHGFARLMLEGGCDIYTLSKIMGHNRITTTTIYLSCSNEQMSKSIEMHALN